MYIYIYRYIIYPSTSSYRIPWNINRDDQQKHHRFPLWNNIGEIEKTTHMTSSCWWFQSIWKKCSSNWIISAGIGVRIKKIWNHHLSEVSEIYYSHYHPENRYILWKLMLGIWNFLLKWPTRSKWSPSHLGFLLPWLRDTTDSIPNPKNISLKVAKVLTSEFQHIFSCSKTFF